MTCRCTKGEGPCDSVVVRESGLCAYCEEMHQGSGESAGQGDSIGFVGFSEEAEEEWSWPKGHPGER